MYSVYSRDRGEVSSNELGIVKEKNAKVKEEHPKEIGQKTSDTKQRQ